MFKKLSWSVTAIVALGGAVFTGFGSGAPAQQVAGESLDLLKAMGQRSAAAHGYIAACVTAIAYAKRFEGRKDATTATVDGVWVQAAGRCRGMANTVCDAAALEAPREACNRIRAFEPVV